jgi:hypothetical protein
MLPMATFHHEDNRKQNPRYRHDLEDLEILRSGAAMSDGVIHTAFIHDFSKFKASCEIDRQAIEALGSVLAGSDRPMIVTSGTALLSPGRLAIEETVPAFGPEAFPRVASEEATLSMALKGVRASLLRLPPSVHGDGDHGFVPHLIGIAREKGVSAMWVTGLTAGPRCTGSMLLIFTGSCLRRVPQGPGITGSR